MRRNYLIYLMLFLSQGFTQTTEGDWILRKVDENMGSENKIVRAEMLIKGQRGNRTVVSQSWIQGEEKSFTEYLDPPRERGTKMLKLEDQLWTYTPSTDRTILIAGHMLRQSVLGSDLSYEDLMEDTRLTEVYQSAVAGDENIQDRPCWVLELKAKNTDVAYASRKVWVDKERYVILKENRYAKSGKLLKTTVVTEVKFLENRWVATRVVFKDVLKSGEGTDFAIKSIEYNADIPDYIFSKAALKK